ncbi:MAG: MoxR family ATPase [Chloroflexi bacterium]|nr:MoxR family ATPase [Chloroflexota bacterium]
MDPTRIRTFGQALSAEVGRVIVGKSEVVEFLAVALLCEGHVLLEDVPGIGKTTMAKSLARCLSSSFSRIQFTPDLLPSDVTGIFFFNQKSGDFEFRAGPIHANVILADEINRATPRTQSALLEAMEERQVTVEGQTTSLPRPFVVLATQNPIELEGTFPLPEAQLDRFLLRLSIGYPTDTEEIAILRRFETATPLEDVQSVASSAEIMALVQDARQVYVDDSIAEYIVTLARATRLHEAIELGASPRASLALFRASQARAALRGRNYVIPDDAKSLVGPVFAHRLILRHQGRLRGSDVQHVLDSIVEETPAPVEPLPHASPVA